ncbi:serine hydrolase domain-containing protein [Murdochiella vaginalis]|uniref:serine hydrolase domain-containing protein n=1 Tax=Murdochiella vaginalis TaxID=1852373 RepID=UPI0008FE8FD1|nr:serine hydrolase domain-containing protein [Murdochiella vaginalis]
MNRAKRIWRTVLLLCLAVQLLGSSLFSVKAAEKAFPSGLHYRDLPKTIEQFVHEHHETTCGMSLVVYDRDGVLYEKAYGYMDKEAKKEADLETVYEWGSTSKLLIWVSVMQLYEEGKIDLHQDIKHYLPEGFLQNVRFDKPITMLDLMNHQAGFQDTYFIQTPHPEEMKSLEEVLRSKQPIQVYAPGEHTAYSNWGAALAAFIVQKIAGMNYVEYVHKHIFQPLHMAHTSISSLYRDNSWVDQQRQKLTCYDTEGKKIGGAGRYYIYVYPAGSAAGTISDLAKFARALTPKDKQPSPLFKNQATQKEMYTATSFYGSSKVEKFYHGFFANEYGVQTIGHGGNTFGCSTMLQFDPVSGVGMVVMTNQAHETIYTDQMYELIYGKFTDSTLGHIKREVPKGLLLNMRGILEGPLSFVGALGVRTYSEEDLDNWWFEENGIVQTPFSDFLLSTPKALMNVLLLLLFIVAGLYGLLNLVLGALILDPIKKKKGKCIVYPLRKLSYTLCVPMGLVLLNFILCFFRLLNGYKTGDIGSVTSYQVQSALFGILAIAMAILIVTAKKNAYQEATKKDKRKFLVTGGFALLQIAVIVFFDLYQFWTL